MWKNTQAIRCSVVAVAAVERTAVGAAAATSPSRRIQVIRRSQRRSNGNENRRTFAVRWSCGASGGARKSFVTAEQNRNILGGRRGQKRNRRRASDEMGRRLERHHDGAVLRRRRHVAHRRLRRHRTRHRLLLHMPLLRWWSLRRRA